MDVIIPFFKSQEPAIPGCYSRSAVLRDEPERAERRLRHVRRLPVHHLDGHDAQAPDVNLFAVVLAVHDLGRMG